MTVAVDRIDGVRARARGARRQAAGGRPARGEPARRLRRRPMRLRKKIVATKEGGAITGEERLREYLTSLYGSVVFYEGRPSQTQVERAVGPVARARRRRQGLRRLGREGAART